VYSTAWYRIYILTPYTLVPQRPLHRARPRNSKKYALQSFCIVYRVSYRGIRKFTFGNFYLLAHQVHARNIVCMRIRCMPANIVCVTLCCSVLQCVQCVAMCCSGSQWFVPPRASVAWPPTRRACHRVAMCCSVLQCVAVCCSALQCLAECCSVFHLLTHQAHTRRHFVRAILLQHVAVCCSMLQDVAVCCSGSDLLAHQTHTRRHFVHAILKHTPY